MLIDEKENAACAAAEQAFHERAPSDLTDEEKELRDFYILNYLRDCFECSPEGQMLLRDAETGADKFLLERRRRGETVSPEPEPPQ